MSDLLIRFQPYTGRLPKCVKDLLCRLRIGQCLIEYCNECGREQPLVWWCRDTSTWIELNGTEGGALCPECFTRRANKAGYFMRWFPEIIYAPKPATVIRQAQEPPK